MNGPNGKRAIFVMGIVNSLYCLICFERTLPPFADWKMSNITHIEEESEFTEELWKIYNSLINKKGCGRPLIKDNLINLMIINCGVYKSHPLCRFPSIKCEIIFYGVWISWLGVFYILC